MLFKKNKIEKKSYDKTVFKPVLKSNLYNQEKVIGFKEIKTGKFHEEMLITSPNDLKNFMTTYNLTEDEISKEW
ncbi:MAG: aspartate dehydrogenase [Cellulosilyticum sp.]|nr:aspartate dehydrogenase [Cellulosilyticum sp.]